jgi:Tol biopolymer transport system component
MKNLGRILRPHRFSLAGLLLFVSLLGLGITQPGEFSAAATSQPAGLTSPSNTHVVAVSDSRIDVYWQDNSNNETGFEVHRSIDGSTGTFMLLATTAAGVTARGDLGLNPSTQYCYKVRAIKTADGRTRYSNFSNTACATTLAPRPPNAPSNTQVVAVSDSRIDVSWQDNSANETGFEVHRSANGSNGVFTLVATTAAGVTARGDTGLNPSTPYCYKVRAFITVNSLASYSDFSNTACATTLPPPPPPGLNVTGVTTGVDLDPDGYWVDVWRDSGGSRTHVTGSGLPANGTVTISGLEPADYQVELSRVAVNCDLSGPNPQPVTLGASGSAGFAEFDVTCAPVTQLAFSSTVDGNPEIYVINSNGTGSTRLTLHPGADVKPTWSPDGTKIAFQSNRDGNSEIYVMNADGSNPVRLTDAAAGNFSPTWSPDGTKIAFTSDGDGNAEIYVMNADGSNPVRLTNDAAYDAEPAWSPDGTKIAFQSGRDGNAEIYVMNADGSNPVRLTNHPAADAEPTWSPDGTKIAFTSDRDGKAEIYVMNADGSAVTQLTSVGAAAGERHSHPAWYPDGQKIAFVAASCQVTCSSVIQVVRANGTDLVELTSGADPAWRYPAVPTGISCLFDECPPQFYCGQNSVCVTFCGDGYWNGDEGDVDCGGSCTPRCQSGQHCWVQSDCASGICVGGVCQ